MDVLLSSRYRLAPIAPGDFPRNGMQTWAATRPLKLVRPFARAVGLDDIDRTRAAAALTRWTTGGRPGAMDNRRVVTAPCTTGAA